MEQQAVIDFFDRAAANWDAQLVRNEAVIGKILDNAGLRPGVSVLDVACGTGVLIPDYLKRGAARVTAIDIAPEMARRRLDAQLPENVLRAAADFVIENDGTLQQMQQRCNALLTALRKEAYGETSDEK